MSGAAQGSNQTAKLQSKDAAAGGQPSKETQKPVAALEEDDEFEDFPVEDWPEEETEMASSNSHLWEESWDDDDANEDFSKVLKEELEKVKQGK